MARNRKNSAALFEVIRKPEDHAQTPVARTSPFGFLKRFNKPSPGSFSAPAQPAPRERSVQTSTWASDVVGKVGTVAGMAFDRQRTEINFRLSYGAAALGIFSLCIALVLAYSIGQRTSSNQVARLSAASRTAELRNQPAQPEVTNLNNNTLVVPAIAERTSGPVASTTGGVVTPPNTKRTVGLNYVIAQNYPDKTTADAAAAALQKKGIPCTVESGPQGWASMKSFSVVGLTGFNSSRSPEIPAYIKSMQAVSDQFAKSSKFNAFDPRLYKWR